MENHEADKKKSAASSKLPCQGEEHLVKELRAFIKEVVKTCCKEKKRENGKYKLTPYEKIKRLT